MELLLDHMLGKKVQQTLKQMGYSATRAIEVKLDQVSNGELYNESSTRNRILVTCDSDFEKFKPTNAMVSIIYLKPVPTTNLKYLMPLIETQMSKIDETKLERHLIIVYPKIIEYKRF